MSYLPKLLTFLFLSLVTFGSIFGQDKESEIEQLQNQISNLRHSFDALQKQIDDVLWYDKIGDIAYVDKVQLTGPPVADRTVKNKTEQGYGNPVKFWTYVFIPKTVQSGDKLPLLVLPHGGVHSNFNTYYTHIIRELMAQRYIVIAPEYRGSTGYGRGFYEDIDYGGLEVEDVNAARDYMVENYDIVDAKRVGILGWSHGGLITLHNIFEHPDDYIVAYAGVPVSDLITRMGYKSQRYRDLYSADYHIGKSADEDVEEYRKRSPAWQAHKLETPLLIHTNTNDEDVNVFEVEHLIKSLKAEGKKFEYEIYQDIEGGHVFDRMDTKIAQEIRIKVYQFLAGYLKPANEFKSVDELRKAAYRY